jgi:hypothetical protein
VWSLLLDIGNEDSGGTRSQTGKQLIDHLAAISEQVIDFKDGFVSLQPNVFNQHDVVLSVVNVDLTRAGEGTAFVRLKQVI